MKDLLKKSYDSQLNDYNDFVVDRSLSGRRAQVYHNPNTKQTIVVHRGTQGARDWVTDLQYGLYGSKRAMNLRRFQHANRIQQEAEHKYGRDHLTTIGHSLGAAIAENVGKDGEVLTLNKPALFTEHTKNPRQIDVRTSRDPVSILRPIHGKDKLITIPSRSKSLLTEHGTGTLGRLGNTWIGETTDPTE
jgi:hypothetical protein